jgi:FkbM family methyltransferase
MSNIAAQFRRTAPNAFGRLLSRLLVTYYLGPDHPMKLRFWGWFRKAVNYTRLTIPYSGGWITLDERDYLQHAILRTGAYEPEIWDALARVMNEREIVWDIGANIGSFTLKALHDRRVARVVAIEPDSLHAAVLRYNIKLNGQEARCLLKQVALSDERRKQIFFHGTFPHTGGSNLGTDLGNGYFEVECWTVDKLVFETGVSAPTLMKIDVESWEEPLFRGASRLLCNQPPRAIVVEGDSDQQGNLQNQELAALLAQYGYRIQWLRRYSGDIYTRENYLATYCPI